MNWGPDGNPGSNPKEYASARFPPFPDYDGFSIYCWRYSSKQTWRLNQWPFSTVIGLPDLESDGVYIAFMLGRILYGGGTRA